LLNPKYLTTRIEQCLVLSKQSTCPRRKIAAVIVDPESNTVIADGYNGPPRGAGVLCGRESCDREINNIVSGTSLEIGCHHAELNAILNAARVGSSTSGKSMIITAEPCLMCAKAIHHAGIVEVHVVSGGYSGAARNGLEYLADNGIEVTCHAP